MLKILFIFAKITTLELLYIPKILGTKEKFKSDNIARILIIKQQSLMTSDLSLPLTSFSVKELEKTSFLLLDIKLSQKIDRYIYRSIYV